MFEERQEDTIASASRDLSDKIALEEQRGRQRQSTTHVHTNSAGTSLVTGWGTLVLLTLLQDVLTRCPPAETRGVDTAPLTIPRLRAPGTAPGTTHRRTYAAEWPRR